MSYEGFERCLRRSYPLEGARDPFTRNPKDLRAEDRGGKEGEKRERARRARKRVSGERERESERVRG